MAIKVREARMPYRRPMFLDKEKPMFVKVVGWLGGSGFFEGKENK